MFRKSSYLRTTENTELNSFSLESPFKKKSEDYLKFQEDSKETFVSSSIKRNQLLDDYNKLQSAYKSMNYTLAVNKENSTKISVKLEERMPQMRTSKGKGYFKGD